MVARWAWGSHVWPDADPDPDPDYRVGPMGRWSQSNVIGRVGRACPYFTAQITVVAYMLQKKCASNGRGPMKKWRADGCKKGYKSPWLPTIKKDNDDFNTQDMVVSTHYGGCRTSHLGCV